MIRGPENEKKKGGVDAASLLDDIFAEEQSPDSQLKTFADMEQLSSVEVAAETEAVLQELRIRQSD
jgi:hypothetical protein